ncbi:hypothetical protein GDO86_006803, partial [Hymenochirus boettgeri]
SVRRVSGGAAAITLSSSSNSNERSGPVTDSLWKMPSATSSKAVPGTSDATLGISHIQSEAAKQILVVIDKKLRNLEKKK